MKKNNLTVLRTVFVLLATLTLFACGGGGGGSSTPANNDGPGSGETIINGRA